MFLIVGLGNPGRPYNNNRHNIGYRVIDEIKDIYNFPKYVKKFNSELSKSKVDGNIIFLLKPTTFMNNSGLAVKEFKDFRLPPNRRCRLFTADATSMYTNIDTDAALKAIHDYIMANQAKFPTLPLIPLMEALEMLMKRNVFQFGDTFWLQLIGVMITTTETNSDNKNSEKCKAYLLSS